MIFRQNREVYYKNIGNEPLAISRYALPKQLNSFKKAKEVSTEEFEYMKRKAIHKLEMDLKFNAEVKRSKGAVLRGAMLKEDYP
jgi:hypothetical protein